MRSAFAINWFVFVVPAFAGMLALPCASHAQGIQLTAIADRAEVQIADPFRFVISVTGPSDAKVNFQPIKDKLGSFDVLEVKDRVGQSVSDESNLTAWTRTLVLETIETGDLRVPRIEVAVQEQNGNEKLIWTDPVEISVESVVQSSADLTKFVDVADLVNVEPAESASVGAVWISLAAGFVLILFACGFWLAKRRGTSVSARVWALAQLNDQETDFGHVETVLRHFLEERFAVPAAGASSTAIIDQLLTVGVSSFLVSGVERIFRMSERVKFAGFSISRDEETNLLDHARSLINELDDLPLPKQNLDPPALRKEVA